MRLLESKTHIFLQYNNKIKTIAIHFSDGEDVNVTPLYINELGRATVTKFMRNLNYKEGTTAYPAVYNKRRDTLTIKL